MKSLAYISAIVWWSLLTSDVASAYALNEIVERELKVAFQMQVEKQGYSQPRNYEVQLAPLIRRDAKTERRENRIITTIDPRIREESLPAYIHHEYAHACQIELGGPSKSAFMDEASATFQEALAFGDDGAWNKALVEFQERPEIPPLTDVRELDGRLKASSKFEYGGAVFLVFLDQAFGNRDGKWLRELWQSLGPQLSSIGNVAWARKIEERSNRALEDVIVEFANWRQSYPYTKMMSVSTESDHDIFVSPFDWPLPLGCIVLRVPSSPYEMRFAIHAKFEKSLGIAWRKVFDLTYLEESGVLSLAAGESETTWSLQAGESLILSLCNLDKEAFLRRDFVPYAIKLAFKAKF